MAADQPRLSLRVKTETGLVEGSKPSPGSSVRAFKGIPYAAPPVGDLRWKEPQPPIAWIGVRPTVKFGPRCMQGHFADDMIFRDDGPSEDCLTLNVWTPATSASANLPVMVWFHGGGYLAGSSSEPRQDGENLAKKGVVVVTLNYRLGLFGFLTLTDLTSESPHSASGNYGLLDQVAALQWVKRNIAAFGGNPENVTIFGQSAGSFTVSALMASPLAQGLFQKAIGESGSALSSRTLNFLPRADREEKDSLFLNDHVGTVNLRELRAKSASELLDIATKPGSGAPGFTPIIDGYFLPESVVEIYRAGKQAHVPLIAGWNHDEVHLKEKPTAQSFREQAENDFGQKAEMFLTLYPAKNDAEAARSAQDLATDRFIAYTTWKWIEAQLDTGESPLYRYRFDQAPPPDRLHPAGTGVYHSAEIVYVFGTLDSLQIPWTSTDRQVSAQIMTYWTNFAKTGNPNAKGLPEWPEYRAESGWRLLYVGAKTESNKDGERARYEFLRRFDTPASVQN
jgi:para-nitrobenzyl esterase